MVRNLGTAAGRLGMAQSGLGLLVALGADAPEVSTALGALISGSSSLGLGVLEGSNIYNLAGMLGLSAVVAGPLLLSRPQIQRAGGVNVVAAFLVTILILWPADFVRYAVALTLMALFVIFFRGQGGAGMTKPRLGSLVKPGLLALLCVAGVVAASALLVHSAESIIREGRLPLPLLSVLTLPVATSIPNTWAAISLARRGLGAAVVSTVFNSNLINLAIGAGLPSLFIRLEPERAAAVFDGPYLTSMTAASAILLWTSGRLSKLEGAAIGLLYAAYLGIRFGILS